VTGAREGERPGARSHGTEKRRRQERHHSYNQTQTYKAELPTLVGYNALIVISDGTEARIGTLTAGHEWFKPWRTIAGETLAPASMPEIQVMIDGVVEKRPNKEPACSVAETRNTLVRLY
jgi:type I site-specific restriction-modification system R (restriction) subunit